MISYGLFFSCVGGDVFNSFPLFEKRFNKRGLLEAINSVATVACLMARARAVTSFRNEAYDTRSRYPELLNCYFLALAMCC